jgi:hypothetical protein
MTQAIEPHVFVDAITSRDHLPEPVGRYVAAESFGKGTAGLERHPDIGRPLARPAAMSRSGRRAFHGIVRALVPDAVNMPDAPQRIERHVRRMMRYMPMLVAFGLRLCIFAIDQAPRWLGMSTRRLRGLPVDRAREVFERLSQSRIVVVQTILYAIRGLVMSTFFDQDEAHAAIGYSPVPFLRARQTLRSRLLDGATASETDMIVTMQGERR